MVVLNRLLGAASISLLACTASKVPVSSSAQAPLSPPASAETPKATSDPQKVLESPESRPSPEDALSSDLSGTADPSNHPVPVPFRFGSLVLTPSQRTGYVVGSLCLAMPGKVGVYDLKTRQIECFEEATCKLIRKAVENSLAVGSHACFERMDNDGLHTLATLVIVGVNPKTKTARVVFDVGSAGEQVIPQRELKTFSHCQPKE